MRANRAQLVIDALTIPYAYVLAGRPKQKVNHWGSFDAWTALIASSLAWCSGVDVTGARVVQSASPQTSALIRLIHEWRTSFGAKELLSREIVDIAYDGARIFDRDQATRVRFGRLVAAMEELSPPPQGTDRVHPLRFGKALERYRERVVEGGLRLMARFDDHEKLQRWRVESVSVGGPAASSVAVAIEEDPFC